MGLAKHEGHEPPKPPFFVFCRRGTVTLEPRLPSTAILDRGGTSHRLLGNNGERLLRSEALFRCLVGVLAPWENKTTSACRGWP